MSMLSPAELGCRRAGAVLYQPGIPVDALIGRFALALKERGFRVGGLIQKTFRDGGGRKTGMELVEVDTGLRLSIHQSLGAGAGGDGCTVDPAAVADSTSALRRAIAGRAELVVVNKFSHLEKAGSGLADDMISAMAEGLPVLTAVPVSYLEDWLQFCGGACDLLPCDEAALWRWWGVARLYEDLVRGVPAQPVKRIVVGLNWILVEGPHGMGLAPTPSRDSAGCRTLPALRKGDLTLDALAALARSWDPFETALGMAAINACCNRYDLQGEAGNGLDSLAGGDGRVVVIGSFPGIERHLPGCHVIEREPAAGQYPETAAEWLLADAEAVVATASTLANRSLPRLLQQARGARFALVGPSATLSPRLFSYGIEALSGLVVTDPEGMAQAVATGAGARDVKAFGRAVTLRP